MNNEFIFNENSSVPNYSDSLIPIIENMFEGLVSIGSFGDTYTLYADNVDKLFDICFADDYKLQDYYDLCFTTNREMAFFLLELIDKSPLLNHLDDSKLNELTNKIFYVEGLSLKNEIPIVFSALYNIYLLSLGTDTFWTNNEIIVSQLDEDFKYNGTLINALNISSKTNSIFFNSLNNDDQTLGKLDPNAIFHQKMEEWYLALTPENRTRIYEKLKFIFYYDFNVSSALIKPITRDFKKKPVTFSEIRLDTVSGGTMRILFKKLKNNPHFFIGWTKKDDNEGYTENHKSACEILEKIEM